MKDSTWWDTHCHFTDERLQDVSGILSQARLADIGYIIVPSTSLSDAKKAAVLSETNGLLFAAGVHPHEAGSFLEKEIKEFEQLLMRENCVAVGEIGLDYHYEEGLKEEQMTTFVAMMELANSHNLPAILHTRDAENDVLSVVLRFTSVVGVCHSYTGSVTTLAKYLDAGYYVSFSGMLTFQKNDNIRKLVEYAPMDRILLETDAPYLAPVPHRGKTNMPAWIPIIGQAVADIKSLSLQEVAQQTSTNAAKLFSKS